MARRPTEATIEQRRLQGIARRVLKLDPADSAFGQALAKIKLDIERALDREKTPKGVYMKEFGDQLRKKAVATRRQRVMKRYKVLLAEIATIRKNLEAVNVYPSYEKIAQGMNERKNAFPENALEWTGTTVRYIIAKAEEFGL